MGEFGREVIKNMEWANENAEWNGFKFTNRNQGRPGDKWLLGSKGTTQPTLFIVFISSLGEMIIPTSAVIGFIRPYKGTCFSQSMSPLWISQATPSPWYLAPLFFLDDRTGHALCARNRSRSDRLLWQVTVCDYHQLFNLERCCFMYFIERYVNMFLKTNFNIS